MNEMSYYENIPLLAYSPLAGGLLTGKYLNNKIPEDSRLTRVSTISGRINKNSLKAVELYMILSKKFGLHPIHLALSFCTSRPFMGSVIFGATTNEQLNLILKGIDINLSEDILSEISKIHKKYCLTF